MRAGKTLRALAFRQTRQRGMSLTELMVALGLGAFLILGVVNVFVSNKGSTQVETSLARLQENGRIALDMMAGDIRNALFMGCASANSNPTVMANSTTWTALQGFERTASAWSPALPANLNAINTENRVGSDVLNLQMSIPQTGGLSNSVRVVASSTSVSIASNPDCLALNDRVVIANCSGSHLFRVTNEPACDGTATTLAYGASGNTTISMDSDYEVGANLYEFQDKTWYVADTGRTRLEGAVPVYALMVRVNGGAAQEMIEGVEYMQIQYGERLATGNTRYLSANDANLDMSQVVSIRIALLLQSFEPVLDTNDTFAYQVLDQSIDSAGTTFTHNGDRTLRRVFTNTSILRNRDI